MMWIQDPWYLVSQNKKGTSMSDNANDASEATSAISEFQRPASGGRLPEVDNTS